MKLSELISELKKREESAGGDVGVIIEIDKSNLSYDGNYTFTVKDQKDAGEIALTPLPYESRAQEFGALKYIGVEFDANRYDSYSYGSLSKFVEFKDEKCDWGKFKILIDIETHSIKGWDGTCRPCRFFEKVVDRGTYTLYDAKGNILERIEQRYVPNKILPPRDGYGDYLKLEIDKDGVITNWYDVIPDYKLVDE
jgi:hypothetical protein